MLTLPETIAQTPLLLPGVLLHLGNKIGFVRLSLGVRLDADSRKLRAVESRGPRELWRPERSEGATLGARGFLQRVVTVESASNYFRVSASR